LQIKTTAQLDAALSFFGATASEDFKLNEFEEACGVGMKKKRAFFDLFLMFKMFNTLFLSVFHISNWKHSFNSRSGSVRFLFVCFQECSVFFF
jgi:hypothetical protein